MSTSPTPLNKIFATWNGCVEKLETIVFKCNLFRIYCGRRVTFIYYYSSLIYSQGTNETSTRKILNPQNALEQKFWTHEMPTRKNFGPTKYLREKISDPRPHWHDGTRPTRTTTVPRPAEFSTLIKRKAVLDMCLIQYI